MFTLACVRGGWWWWGDRVSPKNAAPPTPGKEKRADFTLWCNRKFLFLGAGRRG